MKLTKPIKLALIVAAWLFGVPLLVAMSLNFMDMLFLTEIAYGGSAILVTACAMLVTIPLFLTLVDEEL